MVEFMRHDGRSEPGGAGGRVAVDESPAGVGATAVRGKITRGSTHC